MRYVLKLFYDNDRSLVNRQVILVGCLHVNVLFYLTAVNFQKVFSKLSCLYTYVEGCTKYLSGDFLGTGSCRGVFGEAR